MSNITRLVKWGLVEESANGMIKLTEQGMYVANEMYRTSDGCREFATKMEERGFSKLVAVISYIGGICESIDGMTPDERQTLEAEVNVIR